MLVPAKASRGGGGTKAVEQEKLAHGTLLSSFGDDPFTWDAEAMERAVLPLLGTQEEIERERDD